MILIIDIGYEQIYKLTELIDYYTDYSTIPIYDLDEKILSQFDPEGIIISTGSLSVNEQSIELYLNKLEFIKEIELPILGIGAGHHLLGLLFGSQSVYSPYVNEVVTIGLITDEEPLFNKLPLDVDMSKEHASSISIPPEFILLASSDGSINEAMKHREKTIYGIQFLPERSGNFGAIIIENFVEISRDFRSNN